MDQTKLAIYLPGRRGSNRRKLGRNEHMKYRDQLWSRALGVVCAALQSSAALVESGQAELREGTEGLSQDGFLVSCPLHVTDSVTDLNQ